MPFICRKYLALTRLSNLSIRIETSRFERPRIDENLRICLACNDGTSVENEHHVIFQCSVYSDLRMAWLRKIKTPDDFSELFSDQNSSLASLIIFHLETFPKLAGEGVNMFGVKIKLTQLKLSLEIK